jgi:hypothetical protein
LGEFNHMELSQRAADAGAFIGIVHPAWSNAAWM